MIVKMRNVRLAFHDLFKAKSINNGAPKYSGVFIIGEDSVCSYEIDDKERKGVSLSDSLDDSKSVLHRIIAKVVKEKWGDLGLGAKKKIKIWCLNKADGSTTREAYTNDEDEYYNGFDENSWFVTAAKLEDKCRTPAYPSTIKAETLPTVRKFFPVAMSTRSSTFMPSKKTTVVASARRSKVCSCFDAVRT